MKKIEFIRALNEEIFHTLQQKAFERGYLSKVLTSEETHALSMEELHSASTKLRDLLNTQ